MRFATALLFALCARAQTFDVTSVRVSIAPESAAPVTPRCEAGRFRTTMPLGVVVQWAYKLDNRQAEDLSDKLPNWTHTTRYELEGVASPDVTAEQCQAMAQRLLADRFRFRWHWETGTGKSYELVLSPRGAKLRPASASSRGVKITVNGRLFPLMSDRNGVTVDAFTSVLRSMMNPAAPITNKTGLAGTYDISLAFSQGETAAQSFADPDLFVAIEQQLGLQLREVRGDTARFIFDSIEKPDEN